jgi:hypothetical protein
VVNHLLAMSGREPEKRSIQQVRVIPVRIARAVQACSSKAQVAADLA